jgi:hypothetical protein
VGDPLSEYLQEKSDQFSALCQELQNEKVGEEVFAFLEEDVVGLMMKQMAELSNLAREQYIKLSILQDQLSDMFTVKNLAEPDGDLQIGWPKKKGQS